VRTPREPSCRGYSAGLDDSINLITKGADAAFGALAAREYGQFERDYAADRQLQSRYLASRLWAFLVRTTPKRNPAQMEGEKQ
jgi:hypothetical protein